MRARFVLGFVIAFASLASTAVAQPTSSEAALAESLFQEGKALMDAGKASAACPKFAESQRIDPRIGTLLNLATCHAAEGKTASAWAEFVDAAAKANRAGQAERGAFAADQARSLEARLARVVISVQGPDLGTQVFLDGKLLGAATLGSPMPLDPGPHLIEAHAPGKKPWGVRLDIAAGVPMNQTVTVPPLEDDTSKVGAPVPSSSVAMVPVEPTSSNPLRTIGWAAGGVGLVGVAVGVVFGVKAALNESDADKTCPETTCPDQASLDLHDQAKTSAIVSTVGFGVGLGGLAVGTALLLATSGRSSAKVGSVFRVSGAVTPGAATLGVVRVW